MIAHNRPLVTEADRAAVEAVLASGWLAGGPQIEGLERDFNQLYEGGASCAVSSGTAALFLALKGLEIRPGDRVAVPTYACSALLNAVFMVGAEPLVVDVKPDDFTLDARDLAARTGDRPPAATILVHTFGAQADLPALRSLGGAIVEDCCHSLGGRSEGRPIGFQGDAAIFSFYATKVVTGGHGGLVWDREGTVAASARDYRQFDCRETYAPRFNLHMTDMQAALVRSQLGRLEQIRSRRQAIADRYRQSLPEGVRTQAGLEQDTMPYRFVVVCPSPQARETLRKHLDARGVQSIVPVERFELLHRYLGLDPRQYPQSERLVETTLSLPLYPGLSDDQVEAVSEALATARLA